MGYSGETGDDERSAPTLQGTGRSPCPSASNDDPEIGAIRVIVPAFQAADVLGHGLDALLAAGFSAESIVVVDDASGDDTAGVAEERSVHVIRQAVNGGAAAARNAGAKADLDGAEPDILLFVDADVCVHSDAREALVAFFRRSPSHAAVFGTYDDQPAAPGRVSRIRNLLHRHVHIANEGEATTFWTGLGAVRAGAFHRVGGFDQTQRMMEDVAFGIALRQAGFRIAIDPALQGTHLKAWTLGGMLKTDLFDRAIPWSRLMRDTGAAGTLNVSTAGRLSVVCVGISLVGAVLAVVVPAVGAGIAAAALAGLWWLNRRFLSSLARTRGATEAFSGLGVLWMHYAAAGLGYARVRLFG